MAELISDKSQEKAQRRHSLAASPASPDRAEARQTLKAYLCEERYLNNANPDAPIIVTSWRLKGRVSSS